MSSTAPLQASPYDFPKYYDLVFDGDWREEVRFLRECFARYAQRAVRRVFEPACGSGRLLKRLGGLGYEVGGNDLSPEAVDYCNAQLAKRHVRSGTGRGGRGPIRGRATVGDMSDFRVRRPYDAAFNLINSFRHLSTEEAAVAHLRCMADALAPGGIFLLGLHLTPTRGTPLTSERWSGKSGSLAVSATIRTTRTDLRRRQEHILMTFNIRRGPRRMKMEHRCIFRTYTAPQLRRLLAQAPQLTLVAAHDFNYDLDDPVKINADTQDVVLVLRKETAAAK